MAAGRRAAAMAASASTAAVLLLLLLLAGGAYADCYNDCFGDCMNRNQNNQNYCGYACDKVCNPDADATLPPLAAVVPAAVPDHHPLDLDKKQQQDAAVRPAKALPDHPFHEMHGGAVEQAGETDPDPGHIVRPARVPVRP